MLRIGSIVWGVRDVPGAIAFWSAALDYRPLRAPSPDWAILVPRAGPGGQFAITVVTSDARNHQRHHLDLYADDAEAEIERLLALGASRVPWRYPPEADYVVLADPDGNTFCVVDKPTSGAVGSRPQASDREETAMDGHRDLLASAEQWRRDGRGVAIATVVETWGSAPRPVGSHLVIDHEGNFLGSVSGGCVEGAVVTEAVDVIENGAPKLLEFGVADETAWRVGLSCGGKIKVLVERVD